MPSFSITLFIELLVTFVSIFSSIHLTPSLLLPSPQTQPQVFNFREVLSRAANPARAKLQFPQSILYYRYDSFLNAKPSWWESTYWEPVSDGHVKTLSKKPTEEEIDNVRATIRNRFESAMAVWERDTCVYFEEVKNAVSGFIEGNAVVELKGSFLQSMYAQRNTDGSMLVHLGASTPLPAALHEVGHW